MCVLCVCVSVHVCIRVYACIYRGQNNGLSHFPTLYYEQANSNLVGQVYYTFPMGNQRQCIIMLLFSMS